MLMAFFATLVCKVLNRHPWISYIGVALLVYVAGEMIHSGWTDMAKFMGVG